MRLVLRRECEKRHRMLKVHLQLLQVSKRVWMTLYLHVFFSQRSASTSKRLTRYNNDGSGRQTFIREDSAKHGAPPLGQYARASRLTVQDSSLQMLRNALGISALTRCPKNLHRNYSPSSLARQIREIQTTAPRKNRYIRFSDRSTYPGAPPPPKNPLDYRQWDPRVRFIALVSLLGGGYYIAQCVFVSHINQHSS